MEELPIKLKKYFSQEGLDTSSTVSYWYESHDVKKDAIGLFISVSGSNGFSTERVAKFMWDSFRETYLDSKKDPISNLKDGVKSAQKRLMELIKHEEAVTEVGVDIHMCGVVISGEKIFLSKIGNPEILLIRENKIVNVSESLPGYEISGYKSEIPVGNFELRKSDIFIFSTPQLAASVTDLMENENTISWESLIKSLDIFSEGLVGSQYIWLIGFRIDDTPSFELREVEEIDQISEKSDVFVDGENDVQIKENNEVKVIAKPDIKIIASGILSKIKEWFTNINFTTIKRNISAKITSLKVGGGPKRKLFIQKNNRLSLSTGEGRKKIIGIALLVGIVVIVILSIRSQRNRAYQEEIKGEIEEIQGDIDEAEDIWKNDEMQASELLERVNKAIDDLEKKKLSEDQNDQLDELKANALSVSDQMNRIQAINDGDEFEILLETYLEIGESANVTDIAYRNNSLYMVDASSHTVYEYDISGGGIQEVSDSQDVMKEPVLMAVGEKMMFVYDNKLGMFSLNLEDAGADKSFNNMPELSARTIKEIIDLETFADNIYILKSDDARVLKSYPAGLGYSYPEEYFRHGAFDKATDLMIDGNIYVLSNASDKVYKFYGGSQDPFKLTDLDKELGDVRCGFTNLSDSRPLYVYDRENERIVVIEKGTGEKHPGQGVMVKQYLYRGSRDDVFKDVKEIVVDGDEKNMYLLDGTKVLRISL